MWPKLPGRTLQKTSLHLQGLQNKAQTYEPFSPERGQAERKLLIGAKSRRQPLSDAERIGILAKPQ